VEMTGRVNLTEGNCLAVPPCPMRHREKLTLLHTLVSITSWVVKQRVNIALHLLHGTSTPCGS
jgi:hypothetical protein